MLTGRYTHHVKDDSIFNSPFFAPNNTNPPYIASRTTWDLQYNLRLEHLMGAQGVSNLTIGGFNIFDTLSSPVFGLGGIESLLHDARGRMFYLRLMHDF